MSRQAWRKAKAPATPHDLYIGVAGALANLEGVRVGKVYGATARLMWDTAWQMERLLAAGKLEAMPVTIHRLALGEIDRVIELARSDQAGKIMLIR